MVPEIGLIHGSELGRYTDGPHRCKCVNLGVGKGFYQSVCGAYESRSSGDNVIDELRPVVVELQILWTVANREANRFP